MDKKPEKKEKETVRGLKIIREKLLLRFSHDSKEVKAIDRLISEESK